MHHSTIAVYGVFRETGKDSLEWSNSTPCLVVEWICEHTNCERWLYEHGQDHQMKIRSYSGHHLANVHANSPSSHNSLSLSPVGSTRVSMYPDSSGHRELRFCPDNLRTTLVAAPRIQGYQHYSSSRATIPQQISSVDPWWCHKNDYISRTSPFTEETCDRHSVSRTSWAQSSLVERTLDSTNLEWCLPSLP